MDTPRLIYLIVFTIAFGVGVFSYKYKKALWILISLMAIGLLTEYIVELNKYQEHKVNENFIYNIYIPLEYFFYACFFYFINNDKLIKKYIKLSIPLFIIILFLLLKYDKSFLSEVKLNDKVYTTGGALTIILSTYTLFIIKPLKGVKFTTHPLFWFCTGFIIFYSGILPSTSMLDKTEEIDNLSGVKSIFDNIRKSSNIIFYILVTIGFIYSNKLKKTIQNGNQNEINI